MALRCWLLVWHRDREPWCRVEIIGADVVLAGGWMSNLSVKLAFVLPEQMNTVMQFFYVCFFNIK
jgi:hypothetical protein